LLLVAVFKARLCRLLAGVLADSLSSVTYRNSFLVLSLVAVVPSFAVAACVGDSAGTVGGSGTDASSPEDGSTPAVDGGTIIQDKDAGVASGGDSGGSPADAGHDAGVDAGPLGCNLTKPFGTPGLLATVNTTDTEDSARISPNGTELFVSRQDNATPKMVRLYRFTQDVSGNWTNGAAVATLAVTAGGGSQEQSGNSATFDGPDTIYYGVFQNPQWAVYTSQRAGGVWGTPTAITLTNAVAGDSDREFPWFAPVSKKMYYMARVAGVFTLFSSSQAGATFPNAVQLTIPAAPAGGGYYAPVLSTNELTIYFAYSSGGGRQIYTATRGATSSATFNTATAVTELNGAGTFNQPTWLSPDGCEIFFASNRSGTYDIYRARKPVM
jgi:hypothetical protein